MEGKFVGFDISIRLLNIYGLHNHKKVFWEKLRDVGLLDHSRLILSGDLNLTLADSEIWGTRRLNDQLHDFFNSFF